MASTSALFFLLLSVPQFGYSHPDELPPTPLWRRASSSKNIPAQGFYNVSANGGSMLTQVPVTYPMGLGEPLNVIISANSDPDVLVDQNTNGGLRNYFNAFGFSSECLGQHEGSDEAANLGDGNGYLNETAVIRWDYGDPSLGTCEESVEGGNHFRYWVQNGNSADSGGIFLAVSYELPIALQHDIIPNGYNLARDWLVGNATNQSTIIPTYELNNYTTYTFSGYSSAAGYTYFTNVTYLRGLLPNTSVGINHYQSVAVNGTNNAVDGLVALMEVKITTKPQNASSHGVRTAQIIASYSVLSLLLLLPVFLLSSSLL